MTSIRVRNRVHKFILLLSTTVMSRGNVRGGKYTAGNVVHRYGHCCSTARRLYATYESISEQDAAPYVVLPPGGGGR